MTETVQLRRYTLAPGKADEFLARWEAHIPALRSQFGFAIKFAYLDRENGVFVWAVAHAGDREAFLAAEKAYYDSPERARQVGGGKPDTLQRVEFGFADVVREPAARSA